MTIEQIHAAGEVFFIALALLIFLSAITSGVLIGYALGWRDRGRGEYIRVTRKKKRRLPHTSSKRRNVMVYRLDGGRDYEIR